MLIVAFRLETRNVEFKSEIYNPKSAMPYCGLSFESLSGGFCGSGASFFSSGCSS